jgi:hypothetical protein
LPGITIPEQQSESAFHPFHIVLRTQKLNLPERNLKNADHLDAIIATGYPRNQVCIGLPTFAATPPQV